MAILAFLGAAAPSIIVALAVGGLVGGIVWIITRNSGKGAWGRIVIAGGIVAILIFAALGLAQAYTTVQFGTVGLIVRFGGLTGQAFEPGLHWRTPFIDQVVTIPTVVLSYETSDAPDQSGSNYTDIPVTAQTIDGQQIQVKYTVLFRIPPREAVNIVQNVGYTDAIVQNVVKAYSRNLARLWAQNYSAGDLYTGEGIFSYEQAVREALVSEFSEIGVELNDFLVRKVDFSEDYVNAIEEKQIAQEAIETAKYKSDAAEYEKERQIRLSEAEAQRTKLLAEAAAENTKLQAAADAERQRLLADSEAYGIESRGLALQKYPELVQWEFVRNLQNVTWGFLPSENISPLLPLAELNNGNFINPTTPPTGE
ncbi:MAG: hypothetical protein JW981_06505 [Anaerolineae bacterium]|nr:hypothetical protein [Anaerolineae bacterium]